MDRLLDFESLWAIYGGYQVELVRTAACLLLYFFVRSVLRRTVKRFGRVGNFNPSRTRLVIRYLGLMLSFLLSIALLVVWAGYIRELGVLLSSVFAIIGVALFAQWSILSNVTAGIVLFFYFPFNIGDRIRILDSDFPEEAVILDIKAFHMYLVSASGERVTYPNALLLQKGAVLLQKEAATEDEFNRFR